jgi:hypothetical protein
MNSRSFALLSFLVVASAVATGCSGAAPSSAEGAPVGSSEDDLKAKKMKFSDFEKEIAAAVDFVANSDNGCTFTATPGTGDLAIAASGDGASADFTVAAHDSITRSEKATDGSLVVYKVAGKGKITVLTADDAFNRVTLDGADGKSATCEVDF